MSEHPKEGDLYKKICVFGHDLTLYYGYYDERDRQNPLAEPVPIYPDLKAFPLYTDEGEPLVTIMQDVCEHFSGDKHEDSDCGACAHYRHAEELIGACACEKKKR
ncbi:MAG: hypothetical protein E7653_04500 [Ruminococcaceae bacterium]|nr:hypothetical protein [Oscillospiraceae bacterium]